MNINNQFIQLINWEEYPELCSSCGAFCVKYWQWHSGIEDFRTVNQKNAVLDVYSRIKFGSSGEKILINPEMNNPNGSNPFLICRECSGSYIYYDAQNEYVASLVKPMSAQFPDITVKEEKLDIGAGKYAILMVDDHYILIYRSSEDKYYYHDPLKPAPLPLKSGIPILWDSIGDFRYTGAGIILP